MNQKKANNRMEGKLFADNGFLCMVVDTDPATNTATVSSRGQTITMPLSIVSDRLSAYAYLTLDSLNSERTAHRLVFTDAGWFFKTRENGLAGPFDDREKAKMAMNKYIINAQEGRKPERR